MNGISGARWAAALNVLAGIWVVISPWVLHFAGQGSATGSNVIVGVAIVILAAIRFSGPEELWASWVNFILGIWVLISPYVLGFSRLYGATTNDIIIGIVVAVLALIGLSMPTVVSPTVRTRRRREPTFTGTIPTQEELRRQAERRRAEEERLRRDGKGPRNNNL